MDVRLYSELKHIVRSFDSPKRTAEKLKETQVVLEFS